MTFPATATSHTLADYVARDGYATLRKALVDLKPEDVTKEVTASGLLGHGGAAFPAGRKWGVVHCNDHQPHYLCANADEGEPGTFKDRWILENAPHLLIESMLLASYALQVRNAFVYIRGEFDLPYRRLAEAVEEAYAAGYLGEHITGTEFACDLVIYRGAGSYVCGEASGLLSSIEGKRGYPRNRPPRLTVQGLYKRPTVVNNVETLANITGIVARGAEAYRRVGTAKCPGTQLVSISGHIARPGVYEIELRIPDEETPVRGLRRHASGRVPPEVPVPGGSPSTVITARGRSHHSSFDYQSFAGGGTLARVGRTDRDRQRPDMVRLLHGDRALLLTRILRPVHAVSRGDGLGVPHPRPDRRRRRDSARPREPAPHSATGMSGTTICCLADSLAMRRSGILDNYPDEFECGVQKAVQARAQPRGLRSDAAEITVTLNGKPVQVAANQTVIEAARALASTSPTSAGIRSCRSPATAASAPSRSRAARLLVEISCNMPCRDGLNIQTDSDRVKAAPQGLMEFLPLNHPIDCPICDKAGECKLQDHHFTYKTARRRSRAKPKVHATKIP